VAHGLLGRETLAGLAGADHVELVELFLAFDAVFLAFPSQPSLRNAPVASSRNFLHP
jgi:hypothetical protein